MDVFKSSRLWKLNVIFPTISDDWRVAMNEDAALLGTHVHSMDDDDLRELDDVIGDLISWVHSTDLRTDDEHLNKTNKKRKKI
ncbi:unnamed protein product [Ambrosiozyma monospora]|uniref:Unnamed protein product n=1 Tax=Ambrosiozyma monospora TaxID=43982 RepID=A0ACB5T591_AMBMO|nr:unnamed protein product [Ambrosiozyma monospora]